MPIEEFEEEGLKKLPNLELSQALFALQCKYASDVEKEKSKQFLEEEITKNNMAPFYQQVCNELKWSIDQKRLEAMVAENEKQLKELEEKITDAEENLGEIEIRDAYLNKAEYFVLIGDKEKSLKTFREAYEKTTTLGHKLDNVFMQIRVGFFFLDNDVITRNIEKAASLIEEGGDWDRRNRLKVYKGYYAITIRDFQAAATNFLESISTFTSYELMKYAKFVEYTVLVSIISLKRSELGEKVVRGSEILECLHQLPVVRKCLNSLYECHYQEFFQVLIEVEDILHNDRLFASHTAYYIREMRILAYAQLLESYRSLTLEYMSNAFGISIGMLDRELAKFIAAGRLHCKIDKVGGVVETNRPDSKNYQYQAVIKQGDALLNRIQKLSRVINL